MKWRKAVWVAYLVVTTPFAIGIAVASTLGEEVLTPMSRAVYRWAHNGQPMAAPRQRNDPRKAHLS